MDGRIMVTTELLRSTATEFEGAMAQISSITANMVDTANGLNAKWQGEAANAYINKFSMLQDDIQKLADMVNDHVVNLNQMATNHESAETKNEDAPTALAGDILV